MGATSMIALATQLVSMTGLGGKVGQWLAGEKGEAVASRVVGLAQAVTGAREPEQALEVLNTSAAKRTEFEEAIFDHEEALASIGAADRQDARGMLVEVMGSEHAGWFARNFVYLLTLLVLVAAGAYLGAITFIELTPTGERYADLVVTGVIVGGLGTAFKFFYGGGRPQQRHELDGKTLRGFGDYGK